MVDHARVKSILESLIFASEEPLAAGRMSRIVEGVGKKQIEELLDELVEEYEYAERGMVLEKVAGGYQFRTNTTNAEWVSRLVKIKPTRLTKAMIETLAISAYNQPITAPEIEAVRGVDCSSALRSLLDRGLLKILGRKDAPGKPLLYGTTNKFLEAFGLPDLGHLPSLKEIEELLDEPTEQEIIAKAGLEKKELEELSMQAKQARTQADESPETDPSEDEEAEGEEEEQSADVESSEAGEDSTEDPASSEEKPSDEGSEDEPD